MGPQVHSKFQRNRPSRYRETAGGTCVSPLRRHAPRATIGNDMIRQWSHTRQEGWGTYQRRPLVNRAHGSRDIRGVFKKFAAQPRRKTKFTTKRGVRDVMLLKRSLTQPLANRSCCFAQAVGCRKNVCYICKTQRRPAGSSDSIHGVIEKYDKGYPWRLVGNTRGRLASLQECQSEDWALQSWSTERWRWSP